MPLVTTDSMLRAARAGKYAVGAFNCENMEMIQAIIDAAESLKSPVILQTTPGTLGYAAPALFAATVSAAAQAASVPVAMHLDHGNSYALAVSALRAGYTSIMFDGSRHTLEENISLTAKVTELCGPVGIPVEGELGKVGGKEDTLEDSGTGYTDPDEAVRFVQESGVSSLAIGVGTAHGIYAETPKLNIPLISAIRERLDIPLVLHGASGLSDDVLRQCIQSGISKINFATELRSAYTQAVKRYLEENSSCIDPKKYGTLAREAVKQQVMERIQVCGCAGKASF